MKALIALLFVGAVMAVAASASAIGPATLEVNVTVPSGRLFTACVLAYDENGDTADGPEVGVSPLIFNLFPGTYYLELYDCSPGATGGFYDEWYAGGTSFDMATPVVAVDGATTVINWEVAEKGSIQGLVTLGDRPAGRQLCVKAFNEFGQIVEHETGTDVLHEYRIFGDPGSVVWVGAYLTDGGCTNVFRKVTRWYPDSESRIEALPVTIPASGILDGIDITVPDLGLITGNLTDLRSGAVVPACWEVIGPTSASGKADLLGDYETPPLRPGTYQMQFGCDSTDGYLRQFYPDVATADEATTFEIGYDDTVVVDHALKSWAGDILVRVLRDGWPVRSACLGSRLTDSNGESLFANLSPVWGVTYLADSRCGIDKFVPTYSGDVTSSADALEVFPQSGQVVEHVINVKTQVGQAQIRGTITAGGVPAYGLCVGAVTAAGTLDGFTHVRSNGTYELQVYLFNIDSADIRVRAFDCESLKYTETFYGGATIDAATSLTVVTGQVRSGIDFATTRTPSNQGFVDTYESIFFSDIEWLAAAGITTGCASDRFCPDRPVTRGQMAAFLNRALNLPPTDINFFTDDDDNIFENDINELAAAGITTGCSSTAFCPDRSVTRGQMAAFLNRALNLPATDIDFFTDDDSSIFEDDINELAASGITSGCGSDAYCADNQVTRGQMAAFLRRALSK